jgi:hypothetical protein
MPQVGVAASDRPAPPAGHLGQYASWRGSVRPGLTGRALQGLTERVPIPSDTGDRVATDEEQQVGHRLLQCFLIPGGRPQLIDDLATHSTVDIGVGLGIPPSQIGLEYVARHVMRADSGLNILHDREVTQPVPELRYLLGIAVRQNRPEHRLCGNRGVGSYL